MTRRLDKVETRVDTVVNHFLAVDAVFLFQVRVEPGLNVFHNWLPALIVVDKITKPRCINNRQAESYTILINVYM